jgi:hypothetical protein
VNLRGRRKELKRTLGMIATVLIFASMFSILSTFTPEAQATQSTPPHHWAILISGGIDKDHNHARYWNDIGEMYETLVSSCDYTMSDIFILYADGNSPSASNCDDYWYALPYPYSIDYAATGANITIVCSKIANDPTATDNDTLFVFCTDHGDHNPVVLCLWGEDMQPNTFADGNHLGKIIKYSVRIFELEQCFSGGFISALSASKTIVATAANSTRTSIGDSTFDPWCEDFNAAIRGVYHDGTPANADENGDGKVSILEAYNFAYINKESWDTPEYDDNADGVERTGLMPYGSEGDLGRFTYLTIYRSDFAYVYSTWGMRTMRDEMISLSAIDSDKYYFDWYDENSIGILWANLGKYKAILVDEDTFYLDEEWSRLGGPIYNSFKSHASDLNTFVRNGGGLFTSCENDLLKTQTWDWLPAGMQVTSFDPGISSDVHIVFDPGAPNGLYSHPDIITDSYLSSYGDTHAWFVSWDAGYVITINRTDNNEPVELYGIFENSEHTKSGCIVLSHVEAEAGDAWMYLRNQLDFIIRSTNYVMSVKSPIEGAFFKFGENVLFNVTIADLFGNPGTGASLTVNSPTGVQIPLIETPAGSGIYMNTYTLSSSDPIGTWTITYVASIEGEFPKSNMLVLIPEQTPPTITVITPRETPEEALQDGVTLKATVSDPSGVDWVKFSVRRTDGTTIDSSFESMSPVQISDDTWQLSFETYVPKLPDDYYLFIVNASDTFDNQGSRTILFGIRNWASLNLLPATTSNKAGRTMPIKFSLRAYETVDPDKPFVYNEELTIKVKLNSVTLQTSTFGTKSTSYRIDSQSELYITNFKTQTTPKTYHVEIYRNGLPIGSFEFSTVK